MILIAREEGLQLVAIYLEDLIDLKHSLIGNIG